jgi:hypothetical protein
MAAAEERRRADMGYDGPSDYSSTLARISAWSSAAGMQTYPENAPDTLLLGGEVLVLDVAFLPEPTVHASYAGSAAEGRHSLAMDAIFSRLVSDVSKGGDGRTLRVALEYMMRLDELAMCEGNAGWFDEVEALAKELPRFNQEDVAASSSNSPAIGVRGIAIKPTKKETSRRHSIHNKVFGPHRRLTLNGGEMYRYELTR